MSKLIESLKAGAREFSRRQTEETGEYSAKKTSYEMTQEQLADIYFSGSEKVKKSEYPMVIKVVEKPRAGTLLPWTIASIAFLITALSLFTTKRIFVDIKVIDEKSPYFALMQNPSQPSADKGGLSGSRIPFENFSFEGASKLKSSKTAAGLTLVNSSVATFARANFNFSAPINLSNLKIVFYAKGGKGGENLAFGAKDEDNVLAFDKGALYPFPNGLTTDWQRAEIAFENTAQGFDKMSASSIRFEFGSKDTKNKTGDTVFIKDLQIVTA